MTGRSRNMCGEPGQLCVDREPSSSAAAPGTIGASWQDVTGVLKAPVNSDLADVVTSSEAERTLDHCPTVRGLVAATPTTPTSMWLVLPAARPGRTSPGEPHDARLRSAGQVRNDVAQTLHETVMQTLVATTYLAESPNTSRRDLVQCLRQATQELRCVIDRFATPEAGTGASEPPDPSGL